MSRPPWMRMPFLSRDTAVTPRPPPPPQPAATPAPPPTQPPQPRAPFAVRAPRPLTQPQEPTPASPPVAAPPPAQPSPSPPAATPPKSQPKSPVAPPAPAPSTPRRVPVAAPSPKAPLAPSPPKETTTTASKSPITNALPKSPVSKAPSPPKPAATTISSGQTSASRSPSKILKPLEIKPEQSPKPKSLAPPPSPLALPPSQVKSDSIRELKIPTKSDQKDVLVQETVEKFPKLMQTNTHNGGGKQELTKEKGPSKKNSDSEKLGMSVITLAGENKGAMMELSPSRKKHYGSPQSLHGNGGNYAKAWSEGEKSGTDEEGRSNKEKTHKGMARQSPPMTAYVNSNVQGVNNSIFLNGSSTHQNPGVHLSINRKANGSHGLHHKDHHA